MYKGSTVNSNKGGVLVFSEGLGGYHIIHHKNLYNNLQPFKISVLFTM